MQNHTNGRILYITEKEVFKMFCVITKQLCLYTEMQGGSRNEAYKYTEQFLSC